jgi:hypothetical protein
VLFAFANLGEAVAYARESENPCPASRVGCDRRLANDASARGSMCPVQIGKLRSLPGSWTPPRFWTEARMQSAGATSCTKRDLLAAEVDFTAVGNCTLPGRGGGRHRLQLRADRIPPGLVSPTGHLAPSFR